MPEKSEIFFVCSKILTQHFNIFLEFYWNFFDLFRFFSEFFK